MRISLRVRLTFWYSAIVALSLAAFGVYAYFSVSNELSSNLDTSLSSVAKTLDNILKREQNNITDIDRYPTAKENMEGFLNMFEFFREDASRKFDFPINNLQEDGGNPNVVWAAVYEHVLMNPKNFYIQISDTNNNVVWRSANMLADSLPMMPTQSLLNRIISSSLKKFNISIINEELHAGKIGNLPGDSTYLDIYLQKHKVRMLTKRTDDAVISVAYSVEEIDKTMKELFNLLMFSIPFILLVSSLGGMTLSKLSLKSIDNITRIADEITAKNLSKRLDEPNTNDEVGRLTRTLNNMIKRLESSFNQIKQFTSDASHELKTPLTILRGELEVAILSPKTADEYEETLTSALEEVARLSNVVEALLELSRADSGQLRMNFQIGNLSKLLIDIVEDVEMLAEIKNLSVESHIEPNISLSFDSARMHQAILNLVDNAIKYTPEDGSIKISLTKDINFIRLKVTDSGMGIPEDIIPFIFDRFYRVDKARSGNIQGTGLGLAIAKWIIDAHEGRIAVESKPNIETSFTILLPAVIH
ncbi:MAG: Histidine kinase [Bacteroidota bacterium]|nr:Histidine kinase [Bacteroidota bacterium]